MVEAKLVFTITLICTAALPRIAGTIRRRIRTMPGSDQCERGRKRIAEAMQARQLPAQLQRAAQHHADGHAFDARKMQRRAQHKLRAAIPNPTEPRLKNVDAMAGHAEAVGRVQHAHGLRRQRHQQQEREHDARHGDGELEFSGHRGVAGRQQCTSAGAKIIPSAHTHADDHDQRGGHQIRQARGFCLARGWKDIR